MGVTVTTGDTSGGAGTGTTTSVAFGTVLLTTGSISAAGSGAFTGTESTVSAAFGLAGAPFTAGDVSFAGGGASVVFTACGVVGASVGTSVSTIEEVFAGLITSVAFTTTGVTLVVVVASSGVGAPGTADTFAVADISAAVEDSREEAGGLTAIGTSPPWGDTSAVEASVECTSSGATTQTTNSSVFNHLPIAAFSRKVSCRYILTKSPSWYPMAG
ncbi:membrane hypothetical protein [Gammaproteobacteria bacterium]